VSREGNSKTKLDELELRIVEVTQANDHRIPVEEEKAEKDKGLYLHSELFGYARERSIGEPNNLRRPTPPQ
jgi:hypothetical protein